MIQIRFAVVWFLYASIAGPEPSPHNNCGYFSPPFALCDIKIRIGLLNPADYGNWHCSADSGREKKMFFENQ